MRSRCHFRRVTKVVQAEGSVSRDRSRVASVAENSSHVPARMGPAPVASDAVAVRDARATDAAAVAAIGSVAFPLAYAGLLHPSTITAVIGQTYSLTAVTDCINRCLTSSDGHFLVAEHKGAVTGFLHFDSEGTEPELHRLYTEPRHTGRGIGAALMRELHGRLPLGSTYILMVLAANTGAIRFYERCGLVRERAVDGVEHYRVNMGFHAPQETEVPAFIMRYPRQAQAEAAGP
jgi:ribosomal protein S18 acetylase RimI-like enzyme